MYVPSHFAEPDVAVLHAWMRDYPFAVLVTAEGGVFEATHLPLELAPEAGPQGTLYGHVARGNPQGLRFDGRARALAIFRGPHAYVSPRGYRREGVPTWDYVAVHAEGVLHPIEEPERVRERLRGLTERYEGSGGFDALAPELVRRLERGVLAFALPIERLIGKAKLSQNRSAADRAGVVAALEASGDASAREVAALIRVRERRP